MHKITMTVLMFMLLLPLLAGCAGGGASGFDKAKDITVISREPGSGTRGAFVELFGIEVKDTDGNKKDLTTKETVEANKTGVMMINVANDPYAIGYISLGSLDSTIKALKVDGVSASAENVKNGSYKISRPFIIATKGRPTGLAADFIDFILSAEGQQVVESGGYFAIVDNAPAYAGSKPAGKITVGGSSSVTPIMEKLQEAYLKLNPQAVIEIQLSDSTTGLNGVKDGIFDIAMSSRDLQESEEVELSGISIALDGIAVIVNNQNPLTDISKEQVKEIYTGQATKWNGIIK